MTDSPVRWGILGTGAIADTFARALAAVDGAVIQAVGSRTAEGAERFGDTHQVPNRHPSYAALAADPAVAVVYTATPNPPPQENGILSHEHGKPVLHDIFTESRMGRPVLFRFCGPIKKN